MDSKDLPSPINKDSKIEISDEKRRLLAVLAERLARNDSIKYQDKPGYTNTPHEVNFVMIDTPDKKVSLSIWSTRYVDSDGKDVNRSFKLAWLGKDSSELGSIHYEDKRMEARNHHKPFEGGIIWGIDSWGLERWGSNGGLYCGVEDYRLNHGGEEVITSEVPEEKIEFLISQVNNGVVNAERMQTAVNYVMESAKGTTLSAPHEITLLSS